MCTTAQLFPFCHILIFLCLPVNLIISDIFEFSVPSWKDISQDDYEFEKIFMTKNMKVNISKYIRIIWATYFS